MLDKSKPFSVIRGVTKDRARFSQAGVRYSYEGDYANAAEKTKHQNALKNAADKAAAAAKSALNAAMAASKEADKDAGSFK